MMRWNETNQKDFMFGSIPIKVRVPIDKSFPSNETIMGLLTEMFGHPIIGDIPFYVTYSVHKGFMSIDLDILATDGLKLYNYKNEKYRKAITLLHMGIDALELAGWTRIAHDTGKKLMFYTYVIVG